MAIILVVDDEIGIRELLSEILSDEGHVVELAEDAEQAREARSRCAPDLVLLDIWMPGTDGITLLKEWSVNGFLTMPVVMMSGHASIDTAVEATKIGALSFLEKPIALQKLLKAVEDGITRKLMMQRVLHSKALTGPLLNKADFLQKSSSTAQMLSMSLADTIAPTINNFSGVSHVHDIGDSKRRINCSAVGTVSFDMPLRDARDLFERSYFEYHLSQEHGSMTRVAEKSGLERTHLYRKLKHLGVEIGRQRVEEVNSTV